MTPKRCTIESVGVLVVLEQSKLRGEFALCRPISVPRAPKPPLPGGVCLHFRPTSVESCCSLAFPAMFGTLRNELNISPGVRQAAPLNYTQHSILYACTSLACRYLSHRMTPDFVARNQTRSRNVQESLSASSLAILVERGAFAPLTHALNQDGKSDP